MAGSKKNAAKDDFITKLLKQRDAERKSLKGAPMSIHGDELPLENNPMGLYKWFLNPFMKDIATRALLVWIQEIPPKSRSGKQKTQGGQVNVVLEGRGYTMINGVRHDWEDNDAIFLPLLPDGVVHQHFNLDSERTAKLLCVEPNLFDPLGVDKGSGFEQMEDSPDYKPQG